VGMPECALNLGHAAVYLALAPKSNSSYRAIARARADVREHGAEPPPRYLQDSHYPGAKQLGRGVGYEYPHELPDGVSGQTLMPEGLEARRYYEPTDRGFEKTLQERLERLRKLRERGG
jgi:putative ATPase